MDTSLAVADALYRLGFQGAADIALASTWVTVNELYQWADEAAQKIAYASGVFIKFDTSMTAFAGTAAYNLPAAHVFTLAVWLGAQLLRMTPVRELWAMDNSWSFTSGPATRCSLDAGTEELVLYPNPTVGGTISQICEVYPATINLGNPTVALPTVLQDWATYAMLAGARGKESDACKPEMAAHFEERGKLYEAIIEHLYGVG
jgi:hypothetical protein